MKRPIEHLEDLQKKPEAVRRTYAFVSVLVIMAVIVSVWFATFSLKGTESSVAIAAGSSEDQPSPFTLLWNYSKDAFSQAKTAISQVKGNLGKQDVSQ